MFAHWPLYGQLYRVELHGARGFSPDVIRLGYHDAMYRKRASRNSPPVLTYSEYSQSVLPRHPPKESAPCPCAGAPAKHTSGRPLLGSILVIGDLRSAVDRSKAYVEYFGVGYIGKGPVLPDFLELVQDHLHTLSGF